MQKISNYPLFDVPWLVREANGSYMSQKRREIELRNQAVVDDYFLARNKGSCAEDARKQVAKKHQLTVNRTDRILRWFYEEAKRRRKFTFLQKFAPSQEHIMDF